MSDLTPITREEVFYQSILNGQIPNLTPITRQEMYLAAIAARIAAGGGSGSGGGVASVGGIYPDLSGNVALKKLTFSGAVEGSYDGSKALNIEVPTVAGEPGLTPYIGENGNWWIGEEDTGVAAGGSGGSGWVKIIDTTLEEEIPYVFTSVDVNGNSFSVKDIMFFASIAQNENGSASYFTVSNPYGGYSPNGIGYAVNNSSQTQVIYGATKLLGTKQYHVSAGKGTSEFSSSFMPPYGNVLNGAECYVTEFTEIAAGFKAGKTMPAGTRIVVYGG